MRTTHAPLFALASLAVSLSAAAQQDQQQQPWQAPWQAQPQQTQQQQQQQQPWQAQPQQQQQWQQPQQQQQQPWQAQPQQQQQWQQPQQQQPQQQGWSANPWAQPPAPQPAAPTPLRKRKRSDFEMGYLYAASAIYGVGTGIWLDAVFKATEPSIAIMPPVILGAGGIVGAYLWDRNTTLHRGVPAATALGLTLGLGEGMSIALVQAQHSAPGKEWSFTGTSTVSWLTMTGGGIGGYFWGEYFRPDPRSIALIGSGASWGVLSGALIGGGVTGKNFETGDWKDGATYGNLVGLNLGVVGSAVLSTMWTPSWKTQQYMWAGYGIAGGGAAVIGFASTLASDGDHQKVMVLTGVAGLAGMAVAGALTADMKDDVDTGVTRTGDHFHLNIGAAPAQGGGLLTAVGTF